MMEVLSGSRACSLKIHRKNTIGLLRSDFHHDNSPVITFVTYILYIKFLYDNEKKTCIILRI